jgi:hypothetical protein
MQNLYRSRFLWQVESFRNHIDEKPICECHYSFNNIRIDLTISQINAIKQPIHLLRSSITDHNSWDFTSVGVQLQWIININNL